VALPRLTRPSAQAQASQRPGVAMAVVISFLLVITLLATQVGRLGDMFGRVAMYEMALAAKVTK
jgi:hypothetical protein